MPGIEARLASLEERYAEVERELSAPDAYQDLERVQRLSREQARLRDVVETGRRWRAAHRASQEAATMACSACPRRKPRAASTRRPRRWWCFPKPTSSR